MSNIIIDRPIKLSKGKKMSERDLKRGASQDKKMRYLPTEGVWDVGSRYSVVSSLPATSLNKRMFAEGRYEKLFDAYTEDDVVEQWGFSDGDVLVHKSRNGEKEDTPQGTYILKYAGMLGLVLDPVSDSALEEWVPLNNGVEKVMEDVDRFFSNEGVYRRRGMSFKRGCLLYGERGNGKTLTSRVIAEKVAKQHNAICIIMSETVRDLTDVLDMRKALSGRNVLFIIEEFSSIVEDWHKGTFLRFLDGDLSWDSAYTIATTNFPERIEKEFVDRPGRFDLILHIEKPDAEARKQYIDSCLDDYPEWIVQETEGLSISHLRNLILQHDLGIPFEEQLEQMKDVARRAKNGFKEKGIGKGVLFNA